jgi:hypothetical protein
LAHRRKLRVLQATDMNAGPPQGRPGAVSAVRILPWLAAALLSGGGTGTPGANAAAPPPGETATSVSDSLPLTRGFYVSSDIPCAEASNATLLLLRRDALSGARDICRFERIERLGPTTFRIAESCAALFSEEVAEETSIVTWEILGPDSFRRVSDNGWTSEARFCEQSSLPEWFRDNDIRDLID